MAKLPPRPAMIDAGNLRNIQAVERFFTKLNILLKRPAFLPLEIELRKTPFIFPEGALALICAARLWHKSTGQQTVLLMNDSVHSYLHRIDLFKTCASYFQEPKSPSDPLARTNSRNLLEVLLLPEDVDDNQILEAVDRAYYILYRDFDIERIRAIATLFSEIAANIPHSKDIGFAVIQRYPKTNMVHMGIADIGVGISENLKNNPECQTYSKGSEFILRVLEGGVTSRTSGDGGMGLDTVNQIVRNGQGLLTIRSHASIVQIHQGAQPIFFDNLSHIPGVQVFLSVYGTPEDWRYA